MSRRQIHGPPASALARLTEEQRTFLQSLPKAELHAHLNGCIPLPCLQELARTYVLDHDARGPGDTDAVAIESGIEVLKGGVELEKLDDFFGLFRAVYALTASPENLAIATRAVLEDFVGKAKKEEGNEGEREGEGEGEREERQCSYMELRSTPRATPLMSRRKYVETVLDEVERYPEERAAYILSLNRTMGPEVASECIDIAIEMKKANRRIVAVDLCGEPLAGDMDLLEEYFRKAKQAGLGLTLHIAETEQNTPEDTMKLLSFGPDRLGHATFLNEEAKKYVLEHNIAIEICLTSNLICKTVKVLDDHHLNYHFSLNHPVAICSDDTLPFRNSLLGEYALLLAPKPYGLGMSEEDVRVIAKMSMDNRFVARKAGL